MPEKLGERRSTRIANRTRDAGVVLHPTRPAETANTRNIQESEPKARRARHTELESLLEGHDSIAPPQRLHIRNAHISQQEGTPTSITESRATSPEPAPTLETSTSAASTSRANDTTAIGVYHWLAGVQNPPAISTATSSGSNMTTTSLPDHSLSTAANRPVELTSPSPTERPPLSTRTNLGNVRTADASVGFKRRVLRIVFRGACLGLAYLYVGVWHLLIFPDQVLVWLRKPRSAAKTVLLHVLIAAGMVLFVLFIMRTGEFCSVFFKMGLCDTVLARYGCKHLFRVDQCGIETEALNRLKERFKKNGYQL